MDLKLEVQHDFLLAKASGQLSLSEALESCREMCDVAAAMGFGKILFDCFALEGELTPEARFELGKTIAEHCQAFVRIPIVALVGQPPAVTGLGARIASNRGMVVGTLAERKAALEWLRSPRSAAAGILTNPKPRSHIVYPYTEETHLADAVCLFASAGLRKGETVALVMSQAHHRPILKQLAAEGFDVAGLMQSGQLACEEAEGLLSSFLFDGIIDEYLFKQKFEGMITRAKVVSAGRGVRVFGELVNLTWRSRIRATERMEKLWNDLIHEHSVTLLCAYALASAEHETLPNSLLSCHSHAIT